MIHAQGPLLSIDLEERESTAENIDSILESYLGGRGLATKLAHDRIPFDADPFGNENRTYISTGPFQMSKMSFTGRMNMTGLSPLTDGLLSTNAGGYLSRNFVGTGYSAVELTGRSKELVALHVTDSGVRFEEVPELENALVSEVTEYMTENHGLEAEHILTIGPAGENKVRFAAVMTYESRAFGRGGLGAVLGDKNVKAVTFQGDSQPDVAMPEDLQTDIHRSAATSDDLMRRQGTTGGTEFINDNFSLPTRYFQEYSFEHAADIGGDAVEAKKHKKAACSVCAYACKLPTRDEASGLETEGPEFETVFSFGSNQGISDIVDVMKSNELCDELGLDTISAGDTIAAYLKAEDEFGNVELVHDLVEKIAYRDGVGDLLAEGIHRIHDELGVTDWTVKGLEFPAHDGRVLHGQALSYAVANRGADHMFTTICRAEYNGEIDPDTFDGKPQIVIERENREAIRDSAIACAFASKGDYLTPDRWGRLLDSTYEELMNVGKRIIELERHFNNERGMTRADDDLPYEMSGIEDALDEYYERRGWNDDGTIPEDALFDHAQPAG